jgi:imidazolonepropionase-like amidohydrolase
VGGSRAGAALRLREFLDDARFYKANKKKFEENRSRPLAASRLDLEAALPALEGRVPVVFQVDRAADIRRALALARQWGLKPIIRGGGEAWMVRQELAEAGAPVILHAMSNLPGSFSYLGAREENAALLAEAGVPVILSVFDTFNARNLRQMAANAMRGGLTPRQALRAVTLHPAQAFGVDKELGSLEVGKRADVVIWSADPFKVASRVEHMYIEGREVSLRSRQSALFEKYRDLPRRAPVFKPEAQ